MKKSFKSVLGVTLLEIMLVLAIAAMIIVMSIRYYQNATNSQNANLIVAQIQNITAAADNLAMGATNGYSALTSSNLTSVVGTNNMKTPYGTTITLGAKTATTYAITVNGPMPAAVCTSVAAKLKANTKYDTPLCNGGGTSVTYTYTSTK